MRASYLEPFERVDPNTKISRFGVGVERPLMRADVRTIHDAVEEFAAVVSVRSWFVLSYIEERATKKQPALQRVSVGAAQARISERVPRLEQFAHCKLAGVKIETPGNSQRAVASLLLDADSHDFHSPQGRAVRAALASVAEPRSEVFIPPPPVEIFVGKFSPEASADDHQKFAEAILSALPNGSRVGLGAATQLPLIENPS